MKLSLITCNIRFDNPDDGVNSWSHRRILLSQTLLKHSPDIIGTQEGREPQLKDLESLLPGYLLLDTHRTWISQRMYPAIFVKKESIAVTKSGDVWLSENPSVPGSCSFDSTFPRLMTWACLQIKGSEKRIFIINTHLDHVKETTRLCQSEVLVNESKKIINENNHIFVMGDFNDSPNSEVRKVLNNGFTGLQDAWKLKNSTEESSHHAFNGSDSSGSRIDWILVDKNAEVEICIMDKTSMGDLYPSDHFPIVCKVSL